MRMTAIAAALTACLSAGQDRKTAALDPEKAGPDFRIQGEYEGQAGGEKWAAQVVALGEGRFDVYLLSGGLPGAGWDRKTRAKAPAQTEGDRASFSGEGWSGHVAAGTISAKSPNGAEVTLRKVERKSPTLGEKPPPGAIVLFDGAGTNDFRARNGKEIPIVQGCLNTLGTGGLDSRRKLGDVKLHVEFMPSFMPHARGQGRSNSGVYLAGRHEVQVLDSFGLEGRDNECGGLYGVHRPDVNMCLPPLAWQTYDVEYRLAREGAGARMTVRHNGMKIHEGIEFKNKTTAAPNNDPPDTPGPLHLQDHGNAVLYRNIWAVELK